MTHHAVHVLSKRYDSLGRSGRFGISPSCLAGVGGSPCGGIVWVWVNAFQPRGREKHRGGGPILRPTRPSLPLIILDSDDDHTPGSSLIEMMIMLHEPLSTTSTRKWFALTTASLMIVLWINDTRVLELQRSAGPCLLSFWFATMLGLGMGFCAFKRPRQLWALSAVCFPFFDICACFLLLFLVRSYVKTL